jgi:hypothetical protein
MTPGEPTLDAAVAAFRDLTKATANDEATRQRVLTRAVHRARRGQLLRRGLAAALTVLIIVATGSAARTAIGWWGSHTPVVAVISSAEVAPVTASISRARRTFPAPPSPVAPSTEDGDRDENAAYGRAHRAHFVDDLPAPALAAWDLYLKAYPRGAFAPEARFNRALCLTRLGRWRDAARALSPFARGAESGYRRHEACTLLAWLRDRVGDPSLGGARCD